VRLTRAIRSTSGAAAERTRPSDAAIDLRNLITTDVQLIVNWNGRESTKVVRDISIEAQFAQETRRTAGEEQRDWRCGPVRSEVQLSSIEALRGWSHSPSLHSFEQHLRLYIAGWFSRAQGLLFLGRSE
jgi:hypothetical protein